MAADYVDDHRLILYRDGAAARDITDYASDMTLTDELGTLAAELSFTALKSPWDKYVPDLQIAPGDKLRVVNHGTAVFTGVVVTVTLEGAVTAYDRGWYLNKSEVIMQAAGVAADACIRQVCAKAGIGVASVCSLPQKITEVWTGTTPSDILADVLETCAAATGKEYRYYVAEGGLVVEPLSDAVITAWHKPADNVAAFPITWALGQVSGEDSIEDTYNAVVIAAESDGQAFIGAQASNAASIKRYGFLQHVETVTENPGTAQLGQMVKNLLAAADKVGRTRTVSEIWGCDEVKSGVVLNFNSPAFGISGRQRVTRVVHHYGGAGHTMELELSALDEPRAAAAGQTAPETVAAASADKVSVYGLPDSISSGDGGTTGGSGAASSFVNVALGEVGYHESPGNINKYGAWAGNNGVAWCVYFVCWCAAKSGAPIPTGYGYVGDMSAYFQKRGKYKTVASGYKPKAGDLMIQGDRHIGIVLSATASAVYTVEGNYSDSVARVTRSYSEITGFCVPW